MSILKRYVSMLLILPFLLGTLVPPSIAADMPWMPQPGAAVPLSPAFMPAQLKGMVIHPNDPFMFDFIIYRGDETLAGDAKQAEYQKLIKYFLASLAVPDTDQWVNLSPYEKDRIVPDNFGLTEMGRDLLAQDYLLKQLAASLTSPDTDLGRKFWEQVYRNAREKFGTVDIPTDVISKVWVVPDKAVLYEKDGGVYVVEHHLKVMTDRDYLAMQENRLEAAGGSSEGSSSQVTSAVLREVILPAIEKEINSAKNFAPLRQVYSGMLLAAWYKRALKASILNKVYGDRSKVKGVEQDDPALNQQIWEQYVAAFRQGVFNLVREDTDRLTEEVIPRKYFAGGMLGDGAMRTVENARRLQAIPTGERIQDAEQVRVKVEPFGDAAMQARPEQEKKSYFEGLEAPEVPVFDPGDRLQRQIREIVAKAEDSPFAANDLFGEYMAAAIAAGYRDTEAGHLEALYAVFQARMSAALDRKDSFDEHSLAKSMRQSLDSRLIGSGWSVPETTVRAGAGLYPGLYEMISQGLLRGGFTLSVELAEGRTHIRMQEIGSTGMMYEQNFTQHEFDDSLILYNATSGEVQAIMKYLDNLWSVVNDLNGLLDDRIAALAEYEWWFFQANPFFRGAASIGDAMSLIAQLKMGLRLRDKFEHVDWPALSMTLPEYLEFRVAQLKQDLPDADAAMQNKQEDDASVVRPGYFAGLPKPVVPEFDQADGLQEQIRRIVSAPEASPFATNAWFGEHMAATIAKLYRSVDTNYASMLYAAFQARLSSALSAALEDEDYSEYIAGERMKYSLKTRLLGVAQEGRGAPRTAIQADSEKYKALYYMVLNRLRRGGFEETVIDGLKKRYVRLQEIGSSGHMYRQTVQLSENSCSIYNADAADVPIIMQHLASLAGSMMDGTRSLEKRMNALAEHEWWFFQANPFIRGAASIGDAMSLVAQLKMGLKLRDKFEHVDWPALSMTLPEYLEFRVAQLKQDLPDAGKVQSSTDNGRVNNINGARLSGTQELKGPQFDPEDKLQWKLYRIMGAPKGSPFHGDKAFGQTMAVAVAALSRGAGLAHMPILQSVLEARLLAAQKVGGAREFTISRVLDPVIGAGLKRFREWQDTPNITIADLGRYQNLYRRTVVGIKAGGFNNTEISKGVRYYQDHQVGKTGAVYRQIIDQEGQELKIYFAKYAVVNAIMQYLDELWGQLMDNTISLEERVPLLAQYEWWFFQGNPFGRGAAAIGDAMSLVAQLKMGLKIRDRFEHVDWPALSMTLEEYVAFRVAQLKKQSPDVARPLNGQAFPAKHGADKSMSVTVEKAFRADGLLSRHPEERRMAYHYLDVSDDLQEAKRLKEIYISADSSTQEQIRELFYGIVERNPAIAGQFQRITNVEKRLPGLKERLDKILPELRKVFPGQALNIRDEGASNGALSEAVFKHIAKELEGGFKYTASDMTTKLIFIRDGSRNITAVFTDVEDRIGNGLVQFQKDEIVHVPDDSGRFGLPKSEEESFADELRGLFQEYRQNNGLSDQYKIDEVSLFDFGASALSQQEPRFKLARHNISQPLPGEEKAHLTILSNVLLSVYYNSQETKKILAAVGENTVKGGLVLVINNGWVPGSDALGIRPSWATLFSVFQRHGNKLERIDYSSEHMYGEGFNLAASPEDAITVVDLRSQEDGGVENAQAEDKAMRGGIDLAESSLDMQIRRDGKGIPLPVGQQDLESIHIDGLVPVILDIRPAVGMPFLSGAVDAARSPAA